jgi:hypothetical protein
MEELARPLGGALDTPAVLREVPKRQKRCRRCNYNLASAHLKRKGRGRAAPSNGGTRKTFGRRARYRDRFAWDRRKGNGMNVRFLWKQRLLDWRMSGLADLLPLSSQAPFMPAMNVEEAACESLT